MITLLIFCILNGFLFHYEVSSFYEETKAIITLLCIISDLNIIFRGGKE